jgi:hypothetical protein
MPTTVEKAMRLWLKLREKFLNGDHLTDDELSTISLCHDVIRDWSVAPATTSIIDIIHLQGVYN